MSQKIDPPRYLLTLGTDIEVRAHLKDEVLYGRFEPRVAFIGRSNVGKSSLINTLLGRKNMAFVSQTPGKTACVNFFLVPEYRKILVDLPGYGFAKIKASERERWEKLIIAYLKADPILECLWILWDARIGPTPVDEEALQFFKKIGMPFTIVMTKFDTLKTQSERAKRKREVDEACKRLGCPPGMVRWVSCTSGDGVPVLKKILREGSL